jgi:glycine dehydrogenase subunit 1
MGPQGMVEIGETILARSKYAELVLACIDGVQSPIFPTPHFGEFAVNFDGTGWTVAEINRALLERKIFGGKDLSLDFPELGQSALYSFTEIHSKSDIDRLAAALREVVA